MNADRRDCLYYDGACGMCRRSCRALRRLDWLGRLRGVDMLSVPEDELPVPIEVALHGLPMRTRSGAVLVGFPALRRALVQTPLGCLPALLLYLPIVSHAGRWAYRVIAMHRGREACRLTR